MKHKHADLIHAWADGAEIQSRHRGREHWCDDLLPYWWNDDYEFRIKPEEKKPVVRWLWAFESANGWEFTNVFRSDKEIGGLDKFIKLEWSRTEFPE